MVIEESTSEVCCKPRRVGVQTYIADGSKKHVWGESPGIGGVPPYWCTEILPRGSVRDPRAITNTIHVEIHVRLGSRAGDRENQEEQY
jgi:hypothetical protein